MKVLIIDNNDSFAFNLVNVVRYILNRNVDVIRNDKLELDDISKYDKILLSPGSGIDDEAGQLKDVIRKYASTDSVFGVCLGFHAIPGVLGANSDNLSLASEKLVVNIDNLFNDIPKTYLGGKYNFWVISKEKFPASLEITACDSNDGNKAFVHEIIDVEGVRFCPESILTEHGEQIIRNWLFKKINLPSSGNPAYDANQLSKLTFC